MNDLKSLSAGDLSTIFEPTVDESNLANVGLRLTGGRCLTTRETKRRKLTLDRTTKAAKQIGTLPRPGESLHLVFDGTYSLWTLVPAAIKLAGEPIDELTVATLGFSKQNCQALDELLESGQIKRVAGMLCSHFFAAADADIHKHMIELAAKHGFPCVAMRTHAKLLLMTINERRLVVESSANLRSCHNVEQATMYDDAELYAFHAGWIRELIQQGADR